MKNNSLYHGSESFVWKQALGAAFAYSTVRPQNEDNTFPINSGSYKKINERWQKDRQCRRAVSGPYQSMTATSCNAEKSKKEAELPVPATN